MTDRQETKEKNIYQRLAAAMDEVSYIQKTAEVSMGKSSYKAVTHDEVTAKVRGVLLKHGVVGHPSSLVRRTDSIMVHKEVPDYNDKKLIIKTDNTAFYTEADLIYKFVNIDEPTDFIEVPSIGDGIDPQDKSAGKALSMAVKNALLKALMLETGENEEARPEGEVNKAFPMDRTGNRATDKWVNNAIADLNACTTLEQLKNTFSKFWKQAKEKGCTEDQIGMLEDQKDVIKGRLEREGDDQIPEFGSPYKMTPEDSPV